MVTARTFLVDSTERRARALALLAKLPVEPAWELVVRPYDPKRSVDANRRLFKLHTLAGNEAGYSPGEMHETMLGEYFGWKKVQTPLGIHEVPVERSHDKSKKVFRAFSDFCEQRYIEWYGVFLGDAE